MPTSKTTKVAIRDAMMLNSQIRPRTSAKAGFSQLQMTSGGTLPASSKDPNQVELASVLLRRYASGPVRQVMRLRKTQSQQDANAATANRNAAFLI